MAIEGLLETQNTLRLIERNVREALALELSDQAEELLQAASDRAPQLDDFLIASGGTDALDDEEMLRRSVYFDVPYAVIQHEGFFNPGPKTTQKLGAEFAVGRKYLERAYDERQSSFQDRLVRVGNRALRETVR